MNLYNISFNNLRRRKAKMVFTVLGLAIAISTVVTLITVSKAMNAEIAERLDEYGANIVIVPKSDDLSLTYGGMAVSGISLGAHKIYEKDTDRIQGIKNRDNIKIIAPKLLNAATIVQRNVLVVGVRFDDELALKKWWRLTGRRPGVNHEAIIGSEVRVKLQLGLQQSFDLRGETFVVAGILEPTGSQDDGIVFIDLKQAQRIFGKPGELSLIEVAALCYDCPIEEIVRQTSEKLPEARVMAIRQTIESKMEAMHRFEHFSYGISIVVLLVAALIVTTTMTASVNERTREIGVFRAIGFRQTHIMKIILSEAFLTCLIAGAVGYFVGVGAARIVSPLLLMNGGESSPLMNYPLLGGSLALAVFIGILASIYPAFKASRLDPTLALRAL
ncbi:MAG: ABC transporter permease [Ignavibacteria bacterium GWA2_55_11]|nr:MAG: ABC transporter permease [Ignavibacteria bacterium GWA2_55_11]OGU69950.1 MAG: ABC transporter permease [Ignavibacteria bacterium RIFCSPLOWO2_02_FULL_55_14]OGU75426.1 MAG: ABC transporter permease [Ignavibacteria bacterium RIFCSPLOWO2_12_FULL_56_21]